MENQVSKRPLAGEFTEGDTVLVDRADDGYVFTKAESVSGAV